MAKAKKQVLSLEERLEQALVPEGEQPYSVPDNWVWTKLETVGEIVTGGTPSKKNPEYYNGSFPFYKPSDLDQGRFVFDATEYLSEHGKAISRIIPKYSTSVCCIGTIGKCGFLLQEGTTNQQINSVIPYIEPLLIYYYCCTDLFVQQLLAMSSATTISIVNKSKMSSCAFPLPPVLEQQRIVTQIESLFQKLDSARDLAQDALDSFETRKAAILHKAFTGNLTSSWRNKNSVEIDAWEPKTINDVCTSLQYGTSKKSQKTGEVVVIRMGNLQNGEIVWDNLAYSNENDDIEKYLLQPGDILFNRTNSPDLVGKTSIYRGDMPAIFAGYLIRLNYKQEVIDGDFLNYLLNSIDAKEYCNKVKTDGVNQSNINAKKIGAYSFNLPSLPEQQEIVRILDSLLENEQKAKDLCDILDKIDLMKKSILARAFRGEFGTNDPNEKSALELLKDVLAEAENK